MLTDGELKYYKTEKLAFLSNSEPLKSIALSQVLCATLNPRHVDMFVVDLGLERKVKLQASSEVERWAAVEVKSTTCPGGAVLAACTLPFFLLPVLLR